jgi:hypothetical protein
LRIAAAPICCDPFSSFNSMHSREHRIAGVGASSPGAMRKMCVQEV